ncbi:MAG TPA: lipocalin-like domain-containing protein [Bryobacteraceae bacterium]|nr:lipocalin-like domain-containing protein [Bryobacteraceae bacterium]
MIRNFRLVSAATLALLAAAAANEYRPALPGYRYSFPGDHFEHPDFRTEWWYYTGNLRSAEGKRFGFELVFFRQGQRRGEPVENKSAWRVDDVYLAHLALTDIDGKRFYPHERLNRAGPGLAGASFERRRVWNGNWSSQWDADRQTLEATAEEFRLNLRLAPSKPAVIHGLNGVSQKAAGEGKASHYVSFTRLAVSGELQLEGKAHAVTGTAWMDHEWFTHQLDSSQVGWDWFSVQLDDGRDLMLFQLRLRDGSIDPHSSGTLVDRGGAARTLRAGDFSLTPVRYWTSPATRARYPVSWSVRAPSLGLDLRCDAALDGQELAGRVDRAPGYWEGAVRYSGSASGVGYLEMTGYDKPVRLD